MILIGEPTNARRVTVVLDVYEVDEGMPHEAFAAELEEYLRYHSLNDFISFREILTVEGLPEEDE